MGQEIRKSVIAGSWYPGDAKQLKADLTSYFEQAKKSEGLGEIVALVAPHAGYAYSGAIAASAYKQIMGNRYDAVIVIAPSHREAFRGASIYTKGGFETPLGIVPIHEELANAIIAADALIVSSVKGHQEEHSLEIQLPFLQFSVPDLKIVPISVCDYSPENCQRIAQAILQAVGGKKVLLVASTDLYHGYSYEECQESDDRTIKQILALQPDKLCSGIASHEYMACGGGPVVIAEMVAMKMGANHTRLIRRTNSADVTGQKGNYVVGYAAIAIYSNESERPPEKVGVELGLNDDDEKTLLKIARQSIECGVRNQPPPVIDVQSKILNEYRGAFVTLTKDDMLRGCIGYISPVKPLAQTVQEMAAAAAFRDPRFSPVREEEVPQLHIEISVLTPLKEIKQVDEIEVGKHGIIIEKGHRSGLLLPQVATEYAWDRTTFLQHTCKKAGLPEDAWKDPDTIIKIFSAEIFHESR